MAYRLKLREPLGRGVRRVCIEQLEKALKAPDADAERAVWVHETRKALKRTRALLRLVRSGLGNEVWSERNAALRDIARLLSPIRDQDILRQVLSKLAEGADRGLVGALGRFTASLEPSLQGADMSEAAAAGVVSEARRLIAAERDQLADLSVDGEFSVVAIVGIEEGQRRGRRALRRVEEDPTDDNVHDLRKTVQTNWRQMVLLQAASPEVMTARAEAARGLSQVLGDIQDFSVLATLASATGGSLRQRRDASQVVEASRERQRMLQSLATPMAKRLFALPAKSCGVELATCWAASMSLAVEAARKRKVAGGARAQPVRAVPAKNVRGQRKSSRGAGSRSS